MSGLQLFATATVSTKRNPAPVAGRVTAAVAYLSGLTATPLWPLRPETVQALGIASPREMKECFVVPATGTALADIREGDILVHGGGEYIVDSVAEWTDTLTGLVNCLQIVVSAIKGT